MGSNEAYEDLMNSNNRIRNNATVTGHNNNSPGPDHETETDTETISFTSTVPDYTYHRGRYCGNCGDDFLTKLRSILKHVTIEPVMILQMYGTMSTGVIVQDLYIDRICRVKLGHPEEVCKNLTANSDDDNPLERKVDAIASEYAVYRGLIETLIPVLFAMFLGSWSDKHGSKFPLLLPIFGYILSAAMYTLFSFLPDLHPHYILISSIPVSLTGGMVAIVLSAFSFISSVTTNENRSVRIGILEAVWFLGMPIGIFSGAKIFKAGGFVPVFLTAALVNCTALVYGLIFIREEKPEIPPDTSNCLKDMFNVEAVKDTISTVFSRREGPRRAWILLIICSLSVRIMTLFGPNNCMFLFARYQLHWNEQDYSTYTMVEGLLGILGGAIMIIFGMKLLKLSDVVIGLISCIGFLISNFLVAVVPHNRSFGWLLYVAAVVQMFGGMPAIVMRSMLSKLVPKQELGKIFTFVACGESSVPIAAGAVYSWIFITTEKDFPGAFSLLSAGLNTLILVNFIYFFFAIRRNPEILELKEDEDGIIN